MYRMLRRIGTLLVVILVAATAVGLYLGFHARARTEGAQAKQITFDSRYVHRPLTVTLVTPPGGGAGRGLLLFLHGRAGDHSAELSSAFFRAFNALGKQAPDIVFPDGGVHSYWHNRSSGDWGSYVLKEVLPAAIRALHADPHRLAIGGISMGGFGAYDLARVRPGLFCAIGGHSAAVWPKAADAAPGAFDNASDFKHNDVFAFAHRGAYGKAALWLDGGARDPFHPYDERLAQKLGITMHVWPGGHDSAYWWAHWPQYLKFYATALANCGN